MDCPKKGFDTKLEAKNRASEINIKNNENHDKTKLRVYKCEWCNKYHLTSTTQRTYKFRTDVNYRTRELEKAFVRRESEYWNNRFGIVD
jgi:hypothetical protein